ncbi:MAG: hypothetical protein O3A00_13900 [Planctomycetota bacterium]|nr:hypothetical protein [Planctomycetota bacterium]
MSQHAERSKLGTILTIVFIVALLMGPGPGVMLVRGTTFLGFPAIYAWGLLWYAVEVAVVVIAFCCVWTDDDAEGADTDSVSA